VQNGGVINIGRMLSNRAFLSPWMEACVGENYRYNFEQVNERANKFAAFLKSSGISEGDRIAVLCKNNEHVTTSIFGAAKIGVITVTLNWRLQIPELTYILSDCGASLVVYDDDFKTTVNHFSVSVERDPMLTLSQL
jgi:fatty-acyl-CoA synthase